jgi:hypothetical protein
VHGLSTWSDNADKFSAELTKQVEDLTSRILALEAATSAAPPPVPPREEEGRANGHHKYKFHQGVNVESSINDSTLVKGENQFFKSPVMHTDLPETSTKKHYLFSSQHDSREFKLPKLDFPKFNGEHPRVWREKCEKYFAMYSIPVHVWVPFATINFRGNAELWLQTYEAQHSIESWPELCVAIENKFGQDLYHNYMRDVLSIRQTEDVLEYAGRFETAKHRVLVHNKEIGEVFFVQKFLDGLKYNIRSAIALHKPKTVDAALSLALMQEEIVKASSRRFTPRARDNRLNFKSAYTPSKVTTPVSGAGN